MVSEDRIGPLWPLGYTETHVTQSVSPPGRRSRKQKPGITRGARAFWRARARCRYADSRSTGGGEPGHALPPFLLAGGSCRGCICKRARGLRRPPSTSVVIARCVECFARGRHTVYRVERNSSGCRRSSAGPGGSFAAACRAPDGTLPWTYCTDRTRERIRIGSPRCCRRGYSTCSSGRTRSRRRICNRAACDCAAFRRSHAE